MKLLPYLTDDNSVCDGSFILLTPYCKKHSTSARCQTHYNAIRTKSPGFYTCPHGMTTFVYVYGDKKYIFTGIREKSTYKKIQSSYAIEEASDFNPVLNSNQLTALAQNITRLESQGLELQKKESNFNEIVHETRRINGQIKNICDIAWDEYAAGNYTLENYINKLRTVHIYSYLVYNRFQYYDYSSNPSLALGNPYEAVIFKKFDKMRKLLKDFDRKDVKITLDTPSNYSYQIYPSFETLLFILLENDIKYAPKNTTITVNFAEVANQLTVTIASLGPYCTPSEIEHLGEKGFRGQNAQALDSSGQGIGLCFARKICELHDISISFQSILKTNQQSINYGEFIIRLVFNK